MTDQARPPRSRRLLMRAMPVVFRVVNVPMRFVLGLHHTTPLSKRLMLVHLTGRKSGRQYKQPVSYVRDGDTLLTPGGGRWKLNLVEGEPTPVRLGGRDVSLRPELVRDPDEVERLLGVLSAKNPMAAGSFPSPGRPMDATTASVSTRPSRTASVSCAGPRTTTPHARRSCAEPIDGRSFGSSALALRWRRQWSGHQPPSRGRRRRLLSARGAAAILGRLVRSPGGATDANASVCSRARPAAGPRNGGQCGPGSAAAVQRRRRLTRRLGGTLLDEILTLPADDNPSAGTGDACVPLAPHVIAPLFTAAGQPPLTCTVAPGTRVFAQGSTAECSNVEPPPFHADTYAEAVACAMAFSAPLTRHALTVDGHAIDLLAGGYSGTSQYLTAQLPENNVLGVPAQTIRFAAFGYGVLLSPLPPGTHTITLHQEGQNAPTDYAMTVVVVPPGHAP